MATAPLETAQDFRSVDLRTESQGLITFYHCASTPGYWFSAGELEALINNRLYLELPEPSQQLPLEQEYACGPVFCPFCGSGSRLFEIHSYLAAEVRMRACHVCHGRWIGHNSLLFLMDRIRYSGFAGALRKLFSRAPAAAHRAA